MEKLTNKVTLIKKSKNFQYYVWKVEIISDNTALLSYGRLNNTLTMREITAYNIEEDVEERIEEKLKQGYTYSDLSESDDETETTVDFDDDNPNHESKFPQLAMNFNKNKVNLDLYAVFQKKLDGVRCMAVMKPGEIKLYSRSKIEYKQDHIIDELRILYDIIGETYLVFDGELYHHNLDFDTISGLARRKKNSKSKINGLDIKLQYHIFDIINDDICEERMKKLDSYSITIKENSNKFNYLNFVEYDIDKLGNYEKYHDIACKNNYEGIIIRRIDSYYKPTRSSGLYKYKKFITDEFEIVDIVSGKGEDNECAIIVAKTSENREFTVRPMGPKEDRRNMLLNKELYIGKMYTVKYSELYQNTKIPRFPVGIAVRDYE